jgi:hypothetical protein
MLTRKLSRRTAAGLGVCAITRPRSDRLEASSRHQVGFAQGKRRRLVAIANASTYISYASRRPGVRTRTSCQLGGAGLEVGTAQSPSTRAANGVPRFAHKLRHPPPHNAGRGCPARRGISRGRSRCDGAGEDDSGSSAGAEPSCLSCTRFTLCWALRTISTITRWRFRAAVPMARF